MNKFYISTSIAYTNAPPHIGYALELVQADVLARRNRLFGNETFFLTGTDEHGAKIARAAENDGKEPQEFADSIAAKFAELAKVLNISNDFFIRTTDRASHWPGVLKIWEAMKSNGDLYKGEYEGLYCVGHEAFIKKSELKGGVCSDHQTKPEKIKEENYFFKLTKYKKQLKKAYENGIIKIKPVSRTNETLAMLEDSEDVSFSRPREDLKWGIPVPEDDSQTIYVWADALTNYLSALGYGRNENFKKFWPADVHVIGKDILRFHAIIWPAMLLSAGLELPKSIFVHGFITVDGEKMSKTVGNVIDPIELVKKYGIDPVRYYLLREIPSDEDGDFSYEKLEARYNGDLANNLGNLVSRVAKLIETKLEGELVFKESLYEDSVIKIFDPIINEYHQNLKDFKLHEALANIWRIYAFANTYIDDNKPWDKDASPEHLLKTLTNSFGLILVSLKLLAPFLPGTVEKINKIFGYDGKSDPNNYKFVVTKTESLFPRLK